MNKQNILSSIVVSVLVVTVAMAIFGGFSSGTVVVERPVGSSGSGQDTASRQFFLGGITEGGITSTSSTAATYTTAARDFFNQPAVLSWTPNINTTVSLSGTSTLGYVPKVGDVAQVYLRNASSTAGATITLAAADSGLDLQFAEATGGDLVLNGLDWAKLTIIHTSQNLITVIFDEMTEAD